MSNVLAMSLAVAMLWSGGVGVSQLPRVPVGQPAPAFSVDDDRGVTRTLAEFKGKTVVLEWHEKGCPYVTKHYRSGDMQRRQQAWMAKGVIWLLITSSADGNHSYLTPAESRAYLQEIGAMPTAHLLDTNGRMGRRYGVSTALHMVIIAPTGATVFNGAIDDKPTTLSEDLKSASNFVDQALTEVLSGRRVSHPVSEPYGCSVHYGKD